MPAARRELQLPSPLRRRSYSLLPAPGMPPLHAVDPSIRGSCAMLPAVLTTANGANALATACSARLGAPGSLRIEDRSSGPARRPTAVGAPERTACGRPEGRPGAWREHARREPLRAGPTIDEGRLLVQRMASCGRPR